MEKLICQSCAMPMNADDYGTNADGSVNQEYCKYCYEEGAFTSETTMEQMIDLCVPHMVNPETGFTEESARNIMQQTLPNLKRWKA